MSFIESFAEHVRAGYSALWVVTEEPDECAKALRLACQTHGWKLSTWDFDGGVNNSGDVKDPTDALHTLPTQLEEAGTRVVFTMRHAHRFTGDPMFSAALLNSAAAGKELGAHVVILAPSAEVPAELARLFAILRHTLPSESDLLALAEHTADGPIDDPARVSKAASGLTVTEAENAFALSLVRHGRICPEVVWEQKTAALEKTGFMSLCRDGGNFEHLGGMEGLKRFGRQALRHNRPETVTPRGLVLLGLPGTGKSAYAKALGNETKRPTITLDFPALFGGIVGETEANIRRALAVADAMAPCVLFVDEVEKALAGSSGGHQGDNGVATRAFGTLLTWLNDHTSDVFFICTANDVSMIPAPFTRAERFDSVYFLDTPTAEERRAIWKQYRAYYQINPDEGTPADEGWTGAEIKACCRLAALLGESLHDAAQNIVPVTQSAAENIAELRRWSGDRAIDARTGKRYRSPGSAPAVPSENARRKIGV